jgi:hypothetical protein
MSPSPTTAILRLFDSGQDFLAVYYIGIFAEQHFVDVWHRDEVAEQADRFIQEWGFDKFALAVTRLDSVAKS